METPNLKELAKEYEQDNDIIAYQKAQEKLSKLNPEEVADKTGAKFNSEKSRFELNMMGKKHFISYPDGEIRTAEGKDVHFPINVLILHYLTEASGQPLEDKLISYREIPEGGEIYYGPFKRRAIDPLVKTFGERPKTLIEASKHLNGEIAEVGDYSVSIPVFPNIPVTFVIWEGDDEFPPSGNVLFDASVASYLSAEDLAFVGSVPLWSLSGIVKDM